MILSNVISQEHCEEFRQDLQSYCKEKGDQLDRSESMVRNVGSGHAPFMLKVKRRTSKCIQHDLRVLWPNVKQSGVFRICQSWRDPRPHHQEWEAAGLSTSHFHVDQLRFMEGLRLHHYQSGLYLEAGEAHKDHTMKFLPLMSSTKSSLTGYWATTDLI